MSVRDIRLFAKRSSSRSSKRPKAAIARIARNSVGPWQSVARASSLALIAPSAMRSASFEPRGEPDELGPRCAEQRVPQRDLSGSERGRSSLHGAQHSERRVNDRGRRGRLGSGSADSFIARASIRATGRGSIREAKSLVVERLVDFVSRERAIAVDRGVTDAHVCARDAGQLFERGFHGANAVLAAHSFDVVLGLHGR